MRMIIVSEHRGMLRIEHEILSTEQRSRPVNIKYIEFTMKNTKQRCSVCGRLNIGGWQKPHENLPMRQAEYLLFIQYATTVSGYCQELYEVKPNASTLAGNSSVLHCQPVMLRLILPHRISDFSQFSSG